MPVGDVERAVATAAAADGIPLISMPRVDWLNTHGHFALPAAAAFVVPPMQRAFEALGGDETEQRSKRYGRLPSDLLHSSSQTMVEVDEVQHFTSFRLLTLDELPDASEKSGAYRALCHTWSSKADSYRAAKVAKGFPGPFGRARQRAYNDLLRDLVAPLLGYQLVRIPAPLMSGQQAYSDASRSLEHLRPSSG